MTDIPDNDQEKGQSYGFQPGNELWKLAENNGRPATYQSSSELMQGCQEYFAWCEANPLLEQVHGFYKGKAKKAHIKKKRPYTLGGMCLFLGITRQTWKSYADQDDFLTLCTLVEEAIQDQKLSGAMAGFFNASIVARDLGLVDRQQQEHKGGVSVTDLTEEQINIRLHQLITKALNKDGQS